MFPLIQILVLLLTFSRYTGSSPSSCEIYCSGPILSALQDHYIFGNDSKTFVDSPLKVDPQVVVNNFNNLPRPLTNSILQQFSQQHFQPVGSDIISWIPSDWNEVPPLVTRSPIIAKNSTLRNFTLALNKLWLDLGRQPTPDVYANPNRHTLIPTRHPLIVPGGRFRESYYWDSYWIVKGLILSGMNNTAAGIVDNFVDFVNRFGFVPNGGRTYYMTRSQPPFLSEMLRLLFGEGKREKCALNSRVQALEKEHDFWTQHRAFPSSNQWNSDSSLPSTCNLSEAMMLLNHYDADTVLPRPESYREDIETAKKASKNNQSQLFRDIAAAAESGWDFSSRWFSDHETLETVRTSYIVPVELNVVLSRMEKNICDMLNNVTGDSNTQAKDYCALASQRWGIIENCMWNKTTSRWNDLLVSSIKESNGALMVSQIVDITTVANWIPLWGAYMLSNNASRVISATLSLRDQSNLFLVAGLSTSTVHSKQQWDYPNAWAPLQDLIIDGVRNCAKLMKNMSVEDATLLTTFSKKISSRWLKTNILAWKNSGYMYEKYDSTKMGIGGGGGEYKPQIGFGWSNGVMFDILSQLI
jgi:alpha,alpha-trehalase